MLYVNLRDVFMVPIRRYEALVDEADACGLRAPRPTAPPMRTRVASVSPHAGVMTMERIE
jgi:hypothetical protein